MKAKLSNKPEICKANFSVYAQIFSVIKNRSKQSTGRFDYVAVYNSKRWTFNYVTINDPTSNFTYMFNLTPVVYVLEMQNKTAAQMQDMVSKYINDIYP